MCGPNVQQLRSRWWDSINERQNGGQKWDSFHFNFLGHFEGKICDSDYFDVFSCNWIFIVRKLNCGELAGEFSLQSLSFLDKKSWKRIYKEKGRGWE